MWSSFGLPTKRGSKHPVLRNTQIELSKPGRGYPHLFMVGTVPDAWQIGALGKNKHLSGLSSDPLLQSLTHHGNLTTEPTKNK